MPDSVTPAVAREVLARHGLRTKRSLGQHFLVDPNTARRIVRIARVRDDETIVEVGPGLGSLTVELVSAARRVVAVEVDARIAEALGDVVGGADNLEVVIADAMTVDLSNLSGPEARLVANLPYNLATPILMRVLDDVPEIRGGLVMVQRELGERWVAQTGSPAYGAVSVHVAVLADAKIEGDVPSTVFMPRPKVSSVLVSFVRRDRPAVAGGDPRGFIRFVRDAFGHRRKTVRNALVAAGWDPAAIERALTEAGVEPRTRPEQLDIDRLARIFEAANAAA